MEQSIILPFVRATTSVIGAMASVSITVGAPRIKSDNSAFGVVTGLIGLASDSLQGVMMLGFEERTILGLAEKMLGEPFTEVNGDVIDAVGELTNIIVGHAKRDFSEQGIVFNMASPVMLKGDRFSIGQMTKGAVISIPFTTDVGSLIVDVNLVKV